MITSTSNSQVKKITNLIKKPGERKDSGLFVIEGIRMFKEIPFEFLVKVYASETFAHENRQMMCSYSFETVSDSVYKQMSDTKSPQGIMAVVKMPRYSEKDMFPCDRLPLVAVLENIQDPGNLGTIIRSAEGAGATGVIMSKDTVDIYNPKVIRSTMGSLFRLPFVYSENIINTVKGLKEKGMKILAAHLDGRCSYYDADMKQPIAVLIGNEGNGLSDGLAGCADIKTVIPMEGKLESLNAAVSASVILYEAYRQRHV